MQVVYQRCAAIDVGKDVIAVAVRLPGDGPDGRVVWAQLIIPAALRSAIPTRASSAGDPRTPGIRGGRPPLRAEPPQQSRRRS